ncbi:hypothetical protein L484_002331 [Morus notabilis]|uniref:Uncharacterized protein n=1 Tax=Morus notabilis TaxID=981085 RepID=W9RNJ5_9ROSA|nr:hypothetical protein L484_001378 [Morus notabilis]EXB62432.1 hypothetical protein L484_002331 [Morus notabilis]
MGRQEPKDSQLGCVHIHKLLNHSSLLYLFQPIQENRTTSNFPPPAIAKRVIKLDGSDWPS